MFGVHCGHEMSDEPPQYLPGHYDSHIAQTIPYYDLIHKEIIDLVLSLDSQPRLWLDTGCGTGSLVKNALDRFPSTQFLLADPSESMLGQARHKFEGQERVRFLSPACSQELRGQVCEEPDLITAIQCHHYLSKGERKRAVAACSDLLPSGGAYITFENVRPLTERGIELVKRRWERFQVERGKCEAEAKAHLDRFDKEYFPITVEEHLELYRNTGFRTVELLWYSYMQAGFYCIK
jgi:tRNA (cmo5U34)-methyltransferase